MSQIDVEKLLAPVSVDSPCGENLEYDPDYAAMEQAAAGKPEQQFGTTIIPGEEPDWRQVYSKALDLLGRSKDLRIATHLARAATVIEGPGGLADGLAVLSGLIKNYWETIHPQLDPEDGNDPTVRLNTLSSLSDAGSMLRKVREAKLVRSPGLGQFSYRDVLVARGEIPPPAGTAAIEQSTIDAVLADCDGEQLKSAATSIRQALGLTREIESEAGARAGTSPTLEPLIDLLAEMSKLLDRKVSERGLDQEEGAEEAGAAAEEAGNKEGAAAGGPARVNGKKASAGSAATGDISSRDDVIRAIDRICDYYKRYEPSSPVPLFLNRAKRLASKSFLEILRDLTPDALNQALALGGLTEAGGGGSSSEPSAVVDANDV